MIHDMMPMLTMGELLECTKNQQRRAETFPFHIKSMTSAFGL